VAPPSTVEKDDDLPSVLGSAEDGRGEAAKAVESDDPTVEVSEVDETGAPKRKTLKLFPFSGVMGATKAADNGRAAVMESLRGRPLGEPRPPMPTPKARPAASVVQHKAQRSKGPPPKDPASVLSALEPLLAWMPEDDRPSLFKHVMCGEYEAALKKLQGHRERYPRNLTIVKAIEVAEDAAATQLLHELGPPASEVIVVGSESRNGLSPNLLALLRLARQAATLGELLEKSPVGRVRTLQMVTQLCNEGILALRVSARSAGFGVGMLSSPSNETVKRRLSGVIIAVGATPRAAEEVHNAKTPSPRAVLEQASFDERDELAQQLERATLPDPGEVAAHLAKLRDRNSLLEPLLPPNPKPRITTPIARRDLRAELDSEAPPPNPSSKPELLLNLIDRMESEAPPPMPPPESEPPVAAPAELPEPSTEQAPLAGSVDAGEDTRPKSKLPKANISEQPSEERGPEQDDQAEEDSPRNSIVALDPKVLDELRKLRPAPIREAELEPGQRKSSLLVIVLAGTALLASAVSLYAVFFRPSVPPAGQPITRPSNTAESGPSSVQTAPPTSVPTQTPVTAVVPTAPPTQTAAVDESVVLEVEVSPRYAQVYLDGTLLTKPFKRTLVRDGVEHELRIEAGGYKTQKRKFKLNGNMSFVMALEPIVGRKAEDPY
jgi:hypothetical protein